ncbi:MAG: hypothetical protein BAW33_00165 [Desulfobacterales bacterium C00003104]|nr:MAG: hypothetical protein BAW33_00165 [Desulfobacterales bacterium C00003104]
MSQFVLKIILFALPILFFVFFVEYIARQIPNDYSYKNEYLSKNAENIEILVLGSSHSFYGINPDHFTLNAFNASHVSQSLNYDYFIFKKFKNNFSNIKVLVLPISYVTLFSRLEDGIEDWRVKNYSIYYECEYHSSLKYKTEILNTKPMKIGKQVVKYLWSNGKTKNITVSKLGFGLNYSNQEQSDLIATGISAAKRHTKKKLNKLDGNLELINKLITDSSKMDIKVFLFTPPALSSYIENLNTQQLLIMQINISNIVKKHSNVEYHSFLQDDRFVKGDFKDADHLNGIGAKKLTKIIDRMINNKKEWVAMGLSNKNT